MDRDGELALQIATRPFLSPSSQRGSKRDRREIVVRRGREDGIKRKGEKGREKKRKEREKERKSLAKSRDARFKVVGVSPVEILSA